MSETIGSSGRAARWTYRLVLLGAAALMLRLNFPGHMSWDSITALHEGRFHVRESWNPAIFGWLLGRLDQVARGGVGFLPLSGLLLFGSWAALASLRPRTSWFAPVVALAAVALPQTLIYPAIVWKDVLFSETALAGFVVLAFAVRDGAPRWPGLLAAGALFACAGLLRQNGLIFAAAAAVGLAWAAWGTGGWRSVGRAAGWLALVVVLALAFSALLRPQGPGLPDNAGGKGLRILQAYDVVAAEAITPGRPLPTIERQDPAAGQVIRTRSARAYSPERVDTLSLDTALDSALGSVPSAAFRAEWLHLITGDPGLYLRARAAAFQQVFGTPVIDHCLPIEVGVEGPPDLLKALAIAPRSDARDGRLFNYVTWFLDTPAMSHLAYAAVALAAGVVLLVRRKPADIVVAALLGGALAFAASFFVISIACDYRYLYALDMAAITGVLYLALDPRITRPKARRQARR